MNLCFITREVPPNKMGGIGTYVANMTELLAETGHDVTLLTQWHPDAPCRGLARPHITEDGVRVYYLPFVTDNWAIDADADCPEAIGLSMLDISAVFAWIVADALEVLIPRHQLAYVEAPEYEAPLSIFLNRRAGRPADDALQQVPCVVHLHSPSHLIFENNDDDTSSAWIQHRRRFELESIRRADAVLAPSAYLAGQVAAELEIDAATIQVIPYPMGRPLPQWAFDEARPAGFHCLFVGRIEPRKGVFEWVEAASEVAREFPDTFFHFVGGPHVRETRETNGCSTAEVIEAFIPSDLKKQFIFHTHIPREELGRHYYHADLCAVPSRWDNYPNTCMEAMRCGKLVLASNQGGMAEMIEHGQSGLVAHCTYGDRKELKDALRKALVQAIQMPRESRQALGQAARERIETICDNTAILDAHADWRQTLRTKVPAIKPAQAPQVHVAIFLTSSHQTQPMLDTLQSVAALTDANICPIIIHNPNTRTDSLPEFARTWASLPGNPDAPQHPTGYSKDVFARLLEEFGTDEDYWCFLTPGMQFRPGFVQTCQQSLHNCPETGFCLPWIYSKDENRIVARSGVDEDELLLHPKPADLFGFFRQSALATVFDESLNGYYLGDILRDCMLKLLHQGKPGIVVPSVLGDSDRPLDPCCLSNFCLHHPSDSHFQLLAAHKSKLDLDLFLHHHSQINHSPHQPGNQTKDDLAQNADPRKTKGSAEAKSIGLVKKFRSLLKLH